MGTVENNYEGKKYEPGPLWNGHQTWRCRQCPFDTLHEDVIIRHVKDHNIQTEAPKKRPLEAELYSASGDRITEIED